MSDWMALAAASQTESFQRADSSAAAEVSLYARRRKIYQREISGRFQRLRAITLFVLAAIYLVLPWLEWRGRQAVWFDLPQRKFHLLGLTFWPQDFIYLSWLLIIAAMSLLFFTTLAGRLWCGYACPQTVWTKLYMWIEWLTEGDRNQRIRLDRGRWTAQRLQRKVAKHLLWLLVAAVVGITFVGYFVPIRDLLPRLFAHHLSVTEWAAVGFFSLALYFDAGAMREQICRYACPYARFQGAMFDTSTLTIVYDGRRGEPRGHRSRHRDQPLTAEAHHLGDCIDCRLCVDVCPTGIDIRNGAQYECIGCAACIDACNQIMDKVGSARGLIRYASGGHASVVRPRLIAYGTVLVAMIAAFAYGISHRVPLELDVLRDRARIYRVTSDGLIENTYVLKILNMDERDHSYRVRVDDDDDLRLVAPESIHVKAGQILDVPVRLQAQPDDDDHHQRSRRVAFIVRADDDLGLTAREESRFLLPARHDD